MRSGTGPPEPLWLSITHVAKMIAFSRTKTYELIQSGKIASILVEGRLRVRRNLN
jgi:excisionase family DNA binding protein